MFNGVKAGAALAVALTMFASASSAGEGFAPTNAQGCTAGNTNFSTHTTPLPWRFDGVIYIGAEWPARAEKFTIPIVAPGKFDLLLCNVGANEGAYEYDPSNDNLKAGVIASRACQFLSDMGSVSLTKQGGATWAACVWVRMD